MNTTLKGLTPGEMVKVHLATKAGPFVDQLQQVPGVPLAEGAADANGTLTLDLPARTDLLAQRANGTAKRVQNGITWKGST